MSETTDHIFDPSVYRGLSPNTLPSWLRVRAALLLANSGQEWLQVFRCVYGGRVGDSPVCSRFLPRPVPLLGPHTCTLPRRSVHHSSHNSGTYNNQYLVIDLKRFEPMKRLAPGLLWVVEQVRPTAVCALAGTRVRPSM